MNNSINGEKSGLVSLLARESGHFPSYRWDEFKHLLVASAKDKPGSGRGESASIEKEGADFGEREKPRWERCNPGSRCYDLYAVNPERIHTKELRVLFQKVLDSDSGFGRTYKKSAADAFLRWLDNPSGSLSEEAYACLSNWFLTDHPSAKNSPRAEYSRDLWHKLFNTVPEKRMTSTKSGKNSKILHVPFEAWWGLEKSAEGGK